MIVLAGTLVFVGTALLAMLAVDGMGRRTKVARRIQSLGQLLGETESGPQTPAVRQNRDDEGNALVAAFNKRFPLAGGVRVATMAILTGVLGGTAFFALLLFVLVPPVLAVAGAIAAVVGIGYAVGTSLEKNKRDEFTDRLLVAMEDFQRMVRFGIPPLQALNSVADASEEPLKASLNTILLEASLGVPLEDAVAHEAHRVRISDLAMLAAILSTQASTGGNLSESVANLATMLRERRDSRARLKATTAEPRITLIVLGLMPIAGIGLQAFMQPQIVSTLLDEGRHLLGIGLALIGIGFVISMMLVRSAQR